MTVEVYWFSEQPYGHVTEDDLAPYESGRMHFPNTNFDPDKAHVLYSNYHDQYAWADEELQEAHNVVVGSPETVIKKLRYVKKDLKPGYILTYGNEGNMRHEDVMRSIELFGTKVIPALKED